MTEGDCLVRKGGLVYEGMTICPKVEGKVTPNKSLKAITKNFLPAGHSMGSMHSRLLSERSFD